MKIIITNRQKIGRPNIPGIRRLMLFFLRQAQRRNPRRRWGEISLVLTDDAGISRINRLYLDREHVTDVIAFAEPAQPLAGAGERGDYTGEILSMCSAPGRWGAPKLTGNWLYILRMPAIIFPGRLMPLPRPAAACGRGNSAGCGRRRPWACWPNCWTSSLSGFALQSANTQ
jgi:hypothetical protein